MTINPGTRGRWMNEARLEQVSSQIADDFVCAAKLAGLTIQRSDIEIQCLAAPHRPPADIPAGKIGVYVFMFGEGCLKVGKAGPKSSARFCSQHYGLNAPSTLAKSLLAMPPVGVEIDSRNVKEWICRNTSRINFLAPARYGVFVLSLLEAFVQCRLQPQFEGFQAQRSPPHPAEV